MFLLLIILINFRYFTITLLRHSIIIIAFYFDIFYMNDEIEIRDICFWVVGLECGGVCYENGVEAISWGWGIERRLRLGVEEVMDWMMIIFMGN